MTAPAEPQMFVYFVQAGGADGAIKIGSSGNVEKRIATLQTGNPLPLTLLGAAACARAADVERKLHATFADLRLEGEWFRFHPRIAEMLAILAEASGSAIPVARCTAVFTQNVGEDALGYSILEEVRCELDRGHDGLHRSKDKLGAGTWSGPCR